MEGSEHVPGVRELHKFLPLVAADTYQCLSHQQAADEEFNNRRFSTANARIRLITAAILNSFYQTYITTVRFVRTTGQFV